MSNEDFPIKLEQKDPVSFKIELPVREAESEHNCLQLSIGMILDAWAKESAPSTKELNRISHRREHMGTWPGWMASWLKDSGYGVEVYCGLDVKRLVEEGEGYIDSDNFKKKHEIEEGENLREYFKKHNIDDARKSFEEMLKRSIIADSVINLKEAFERVKNGERAIILLDGDHYVPLTGFDGENVYYNNSSKEGTEIDRKKSLADFERKWGKFNLNTVILIKNK